MAKAVLVLLLSVLSLWYVQDVSALDCYKCSSLSGLNQPCELDPTTGENETCSESQTQCITMKVTGLFRPTMISRHCAPAGYCDLATVGSNLFNIIASCETCDNDLCNSA